MRIPRARTVVAAAVLAALIASAAAWFYCAAPTVDMARYAPESSLVFVQVDRVSEVAKGLESTDAWRRLAPALGLPSEIGYGGGVAETLGRLGLGPDEAVALGRAQLGLVVTAVEAGTEPPPEGSDETGSIVIRPRFALLVETHLREGRVREAVDARLPDLARRAYGDDVRIGGDSYAGTEIGIARPAQGERQIVWAVRGGLAIVGNHPDPVRSVLDTVGGNEPSLANSFYLAKVRPAVGGDRASVFAYFSEAGVSRLVGVGPGVVAATITADPDRATVVSRVFGGISERAVRAVGYSGTFEEGRFTDRYFALLTPNLAETLARDVRVPEGEPDGPDLVPEGVADVTLLRLDRPAESAEALLAALSSNVNVGVSATLTEIAIRMRREYGVDPSQPIGPALAGELLFLDFGGGQPVAALFEVRDQVSVLPVVERYLRGGGGPVSSETYKGVEILKSSGEEERAAAFVGRFLVYATRDQIASLVDARGGGKGGAGLRAAIARCPEAVLVSQRDDASATADLFLAISGATKEGAGDPQRLEEPAIRDALGALPPAVSTTAFRDGGLYVETRSAVGNLSYLTALL